MNNKELGKLAALAPNEEQQHYQAMLDNGFKTVGGLAALNAGGGLTGFGTVAGAGIGAVATALQKEQKKRWLRNILLGAGIGAVPGLGLATVGALTLRSGARGFAAEADRVPQQ